MEKQNIKAFLSCSLRDEDKEFVNFIARLCRKFGFMPYGTVGKYEAAPLPIWQQMINGIKNSDCVILAATPRYIQLNINDQKTGGKAISEMLHVEMGMAAIEGKPVLAFVQKGTNVGNFLSQYVQYIEIDLKNTDELKQKLPLISNYFRSALSIVEKNKASKKNKDLWKFAGGILAAIGALSILDSVFSDDDEEEDFY